MQLMKVMVVVAVAAAASGCATPVRNYEPKRTEISEPAIGADAVAHVGDSMLRQGTFTEHEAMFVEEDTPLGVFNPYTIGRGYYLKTGEDKESAFFAIDNPFEGGGTMTKAALADPRKAVQAYKNENRLCGVSAFNAQVCSEKAKYRFTTKAVATADAFQQTLLYNGKVGRRINVGYREFSGDIARPAFNNEVEYDLDQSSVIGYKGARIEVIEATNEYIRYRVLQNFNGAR